jgi:hypothetical protein
LKRYITAFFLVLSFLLLVYSLNIYIHVYSFNHTNVKENISYLSSDYFKGRLSGTTENIEVSTFIKNQFEKNGLLPYDGSYYDQFETNYPHRINETPFLKIFDSKGTLVKEFKYGIDYKEEMLNFKKNSLNFTKKDSIKQTEGALQVTIGSDGFVFFVPNNNSLDFRSSFMESDPRFQSLYIMVTKDTLKDIKTYTEKNYKISCYIPIDIKKATLNNVVGYIEGKNTLAPPVIISAHFDHLGSDLSGKVYKGAFDNASGISFILELNKYIASLGKPDRNIIFAAFNAEEFGCLGSEHFVQKYSKVLKGAKVYNFDMIGSSNVPLSIMGGSKDTNNTPFMHSISTTCSNEKINYKVIFDDASDHEAFRKNGIDAITFCDSDLSKIHTPEDKVQYISTSAIDRCFKVASKEILKKGFGSNIFLVYNKNILIFSSVGSLLFLILLLIQLRKKGMTQNSPK